MHAEPIEHRCTQTTVAGFRCAHKATWTAIDKRRGEREYYCTRHANQYLPWRRGGERT